MATTRAMATLMMMDDAGDDAYFDAYGGDDDDGDDADEVDPDNNDDDGEDNDNNNDLSDVGNGFIYFVGSNGTLALDSTPLEALATAAEDLLHFVVFVPPPEQRPLRIRLSRDSTAVTHAFTLTSWGGVFIHNPTQVLQLVS